MFVKHLNDFSMNVTAYLNVKCQTRTNITNGIMQNAKLLIAFPPVLCQMKENAGNYDS